MHKHTICHTCVAQAPSWLDYFITVNLLLMVFVVLMSLSIVVYEEHDNKALQDFANAVDTSLKHTMPMGVLLMNGGLFLLGRYGKSDQLAVVSWSALGGQVVLIVGYVACLKRAGRFRMKSRKRATSGYAPLTSFVKSSTRSTRNLVRSGTQMLRGSSTQISSAARSAVDDSGSEASSPQVLRGFATLLRRTQ